MKRREVLKLIAGTSGSAAMANLVGAYPVFGAPAAIRDAVDDALNGPDASQKTVTEQIADYIVGARFESLPPEVIQKAKELIVFFFGRALEGAATEEARQMFMVVEPSVPAAGGASVIGHRVKLTPSYAAFANCSLMRGTLGQDDVIWPEGIHAGVVTLPAALALSETRKRSGKELLLSMVVGYEVMGKLGRAANGWDTRLPRRPTNIYGAFGPITAAGRLLDLNPRQMAHALGYAVNVGFGIPEGGMAQHYYSLIGWNGLLAAQLAAAGGVAYGRKTIEGKNGLYRSFFGKVPDELSQLVSELGSDWEILRAEQKLHQGTGANSVAIGYVQKQAECGSVEADQIQSVDVVLPYIKHAEMRKEAVAAQGPFEKPVDAFSSLPYALALVLLAKGEPAPQWYAVDADKTTFNDPHVAQLMKLINVSFEEGHASARYCRIAIATKDGRQLTETIEDVRLAFPRQEWAAWLQRFNQGRLPAEKLRRLEALIGNLDGVEDVRELVTAATPA